MLTYLLYTYVGSGKSTLALSLFRFVEPTEGRISVDGIDITKIGLTDLRSKLTIIPRAYIFRRMLCPFSDIIFSEDPTILSGTLRSTLDVFNEYEDAEIVRIQFIQLIWILIRSGQFEALRRVHLIPSEDEPIMEDDEENVNVFRNLDSPVSEGGDNFSTG